MAQRRSLSTARRSETCSQGDSTFSVPLVRAFAAQADTDPNEFTHGFHSYPARLHGSLVASLLRSFGSGRRSVLDPFCGSGTVLVEAMRHGWRSLGSDLNPLALRLARVKTQRRDAASLETFNNCLARVVAGSSRRVRERAPARAPLPREELQWYDVHVLKELAGLREEISKIESKDDRCGLEMLFSAIIIKFSRQKSDTSEQRVKKTIRKGLATEFFARRGLEWVERWRSFSEALPAVCHPPKIVQSDARRLPHTLSGSYKCDLILTSPPYGGTYDYVDHHRRRYPWLAIRPKALQEGEIGARRHLARNPQGREQWERELGQCLGAMGTLLRAEGVAVLLMGDGEIDGKRVDTQSQLSRLAPRAGLRVLAMASQPRPDHRGGNPRREHLIALVKD
ncbi:MAG: hypothetical protein V3V08_06320 [Nannocystaceae bacterium]